MEIDYGLLVQPQSSFWVSYRFSAGLARRFWGVVITIIGLLFGLCWVYRRSAFMLLLSLKGLGGYKMGNMKLGI
jgi:hypothetical protein